MEKSRPKIVRTERRAQIQFTDGETWGPFMVKGTQVVGAMLMVSVDDDYEVKNSTGPTSRVTLGFPMDEVRGFIEYDEEVGGNA